jgi:hypothetical protein
VIPRPGRCSPSSPGSPGYCKLTSLTADVVGQLLSKVCGERPCRSPRCTKRTGGNPFFVQQTGLLAAQGAAGSGFGHRRAARGR